ncbi:hypothetical protein BY458DRAFT_559906 [Sporodiniella umbellata]|nr:hypothetical protein BY458DRAFT_559906 [Sporodiniella umbellata]
MKLKKLFSPKPKENKESKPKHIPQRDSTRSSMSLSFSRRLKKRPSSITTQPSIPFEQDKMEFPATPSPSDDDSSPCSTKNDIRQQRENMYKDHSIERLESLVEACQQKNEFLKSRLEAYELMEEQIRALLGDDTDHAPLVSLCTKYAEEKKELQEALNSGRNQWTQDVDRLRQETNTEHEAAIDDLRAELDTLSQSYQTLTEDHQHLLDQTDLLKQEAVAHRSAYDALQLQSQKEIAQAAQSATVEYKHRLAAKDQELEHLAGQYALSLQKQRQLDIQLKTQAEHEKSALQKQGDVLGKQIERHQQEIVRLQSLHRPNTSRTKSTQQEELMKMHTKAQLGLIEYLEGEDDVLQAMTRFKKQLETDLL